MFKTNANGDGHHYHHTHGLQHGYEQAATTQLRVERNVLEKNNRLAEYNPGWPACRGVLALNLVSSPGAGKTTLLERTVRELSGDLPVSVIEGDQETYHDARRFRAAGSPAVQVNTGVAYHIDTAMVARELGELDPASGSVVFFENVGNLVCPALFDLGERAKYHSRLSASSKGCSA